MKRLYKVTCSGRSSFSITNFENIYVVALDVKEAADKAMDRIRELGYDKVDDYVSQVTLVADEMESNRCLLVV